MTETQLLDIVKHARQNFWETQQKFSKRAEILELTANTTSLSLNDFGKARELIARGVEITKEYTNGQPGNKPGWNKKEV